MEKRQTHSRIKFTIDSELDCDELYELYKTLLPNDDVQIHSANFPVKWRHDVTITKNPVDYHKLLKKYIEHVGSCEGVTFLADYKRNDSGGIFTDEEWKELGKLEEEHDEF